MASTAASSWPATRSRTTALVGAHLPSSVSTPWSLGDSVMLSGRRSRMVYLPQEGWARRDMSLSLQCEAQAESSPSACHGAMTLGAVWRGTRQAEAGATRSRGSEHEVVTAPRRAAQLNAGARSSSRQVERERHVREAVVEADALQACEAGLRERVLARRRRSPVALRAAREAGRYLQSRAAPHRSERQVEP